MKRLWLPLFAFAVLSAACQGGDDPPPSQPLSGTVVSVDGRPVPDAVIEVDGEQTQTDERGQFAVEGDGREAWVSVQAKGFVSRTRAASPGDPVLVRLTPDTDGGTVSLHFAGDVMAGRRFYDRNDDGNRDDALLSFPPSAEEHEALLADITPLFADADLSIVNLESPLTSDPWFDPTGSRPSGFHPTREFAFASDPLAADALAASGIDVVDLGNNHLFDALQPGISGTIEALDEAEVAYFGAGSDVDDAWRPAMVTVNGQRFAFLGCTTISGDEHTITYVATQRKGGAAPCEMQRLTAEIAAVRSQVDGVIVMIHGGYEYDPVPSSNIKAFTEAARQAGATLVVNHHPHVIGGLDWDGRTVAALNMGNFVFDQTIWQTFRSYVLAVHLADGTVQRAYGEPIVIDDYTPRGLVGRAADQVIRTVAGLNPGPYVMEDGAVEVDLHDETARRTSTRTVNGQSGQDLFRLAVGQRLIGTAGSPARLGMDLLAVGDFEDEDVDDETDEADFWARTSASDFGPGLGIADSNGARLSRAIGDTTPAYLNPQHRILLKQRSQVTLVGSVRPSQYADVSVQLSWYPDTNGPSSSQTIETIELDEADEGKWVPFRLDAQAPPGTVAVGPYLLLDPPSTYNDVEVDVDELALIRWAPPGTPPSPLYDYIDAAGKSEITTAVEHLPGGDGWALTAQAPLIAVP